jgi:uncharacterized protein DUF3833
MNLLACASIVFVMTSTAVTAATPRTDRLQDPLRFFEGRTVSNSRVKVVLKKSYQSRSIGWGAMQPDGSLHLVQRVEDEAKPPRERIWRIRRSGANGFTGTMTEALGPVRIEEVGERYRFRFRMKNNLSVEEWLAPLEGDAVRSIMTVRKFGVTVARSEGVIRKIGDQ